MWDGEESLINGKTSGGSRLIAERRMLHRFIKLSTEINSDQMD